MGADAEEKQKKPYFIFNVLAEKPSTTGSWLTHKILSESYSGNTGSYNRFLTPMGVIWRFFTFWNRKRLLDEKTGELLFNDEE